VADGPPAAPSAAAPDGSAPPAVFPDAKAYAAIVEEAPIGIYIAQGGLLIYGNRWLREYCGIAMSDLPRSPLSVVVPEDRALVLEQMTKRMRGEDALPHYTVRIPRHDGLVGHMELYAQVVSWHGRPAIQGSVVDISFRVEAERRLARYTAHLEESNRYRQLFGEIISNDLLNPVWVVQNYLRMVRDEGVTERQQTLISRALENLEKSRDILQDARTYLRIQEPRRLAAERLDLGELICAAADGLKRQSEHNGQRVEVSLPGPITVMGNPSLREVFTNLLSNAIEHSPHGAAIEVVVNAGDLTRIEVRDRGPGVPKQERERIFRRFERLGTGGGVGLGLSIVKTIVELHGGKVWVEDNPGGGSVFALELPTAMRRSEDRAGRAENPAENE
jgi:PAS domain S-box-containing protein